MRKRFERFCLRNRDKGIPNLMLYIVFANGIVALMSYLGFSEIYDMLFFRRDMILQGQVWRLITWPLTITSGTASGIFLDLILLYCYYSLARAIENVWGTLRFNLFYFSGILLMDIFAMTLGGLPLIKEYAGIYIVDGVINQGWALYALNMPTYLNLALLIGYATLYRDAQFLIFFVIPIRAWLLALFYLAVLGVQIIQLSVPVMYFPHNLFPLVALANYFLFFGKDVLDLLPDSWRVRRKPKKQYAPQQPIRFNGNEPKAKASYLHRCTVCGRTDVTNPGLEFRYCSRCNGYFCYCEDHISNHEHVE